MEGIELRARRRALGLEQSELLDAFAIAEDGAGPSQSTLSQWERGKTPVTRPVDRDLVLRDLEDVLDMLVDEIYEAVLASSGKLDSSTVTAVAWRTAEDWWAMDARAHAGRWPVSLQQTAVARAAADAWANDEISVKIVEG